MRRWESPVLPELPFSDGASVACEAPSGATPDIRQPSSTPSTPRT
ncbi:conserved domain protein [Actinomyces sp. oral taxon 170 str. F0386]|nr:conserved domain protein [Actinomyces sp. oral taxon 170 str. F0386]